MNNTEPAPRLIAISRVAARAWTNFTLAEIKAMVACLSQVSWKNAFPPSVTLDKRALATCLGLEMSDKHLSDSLIMHLRDMPSHSRINFSSWDKTTYAPGHLLTSINAARGTITFCFNPKYASLFGPLSADYITLLNTDIYALKHRRAFYLYEYLRANSDTRTLNSKSFSGATLKSVLRLPQSGPGSYTRSAGTVAERDTGTVFGVPNPTETSKSVDTRDDRTVPRAPTTPRPLPSPELPQALLADSSGFPPASFDRTNFEKYVLHPVLADLASCRMVRLAPDPTGSLCGKEKQGSCVTGYTLSWSIDLYPIRRLPSFPSPESPQAPSRDTSGTSQERDMSPMPEHSLARLADSSGTPRERDMGTVFGVPNPTETSKSVDTRDDRTVPCVPTPPRPLPAPESPQAPSRETSGTPQARLAGSSGSPQSPMPEHSQARLAGSSDSPQSCLSNSYATFYQQTRNRFANFPQHVYTAEDFARIEYLKRTQGKSR